MPKRVDASTKQKTLITEKAGRLFWDKGYDNTSIRDIARACGFESSNIYYYFHNKEEILFEVLWQDINQLVESIKYLEKDDKRSPVERLRSLIEIQVDLMLRNQKSSLRLLHDAELKRLALKHRMRVIRARDTYDRIIREIIQSGIDNGDFAHVDKKLAGFTIASTIVRTRIWFSPKGKYSVEEVADFIFNFMTNGLVGFKPSKKKQK